VTLAVFVAVYALLHALRTPPPVHYGGGIAPLVTLPSRAEQVDRLASEEFDILIVGGGASGAGTALDAVSRGLRVAIVEMEDFASGTSSRSTKLIHAGVRYLRKAITKRDASQLQLVREALRERAVMLHQAPHLTSPLPIITPLYSWKDLPFNWFLLKIYDALAFPRLQASYYMGKEAIAAELPMIQQEGLIGGVIYADGSFNDARFCLAAITTAVDLGGLVALNHAPVVGITHGQDGMVNGAVVRDELTGAELVVSAKAVVNVTGHFVDEIRLMDDPNAVPMLMPAAGAHVVLPKSVSSSDTGILIPHTDDGRVLFVQPWQGHTLVGTTDSPAEVSNNPRPREEDIEYILRHVNKYLAVEVARDDVLAAWAGIRPLVRSLDASDTASVSREHSIFTSRTGLHSLAGGKWTTYRAYSAQLVQHVMDFHGLTGAEDLAQHFDTATVQLVGGREYNPNFAQVLASRFNIPLDVAEHLNGNYGDQALHVAGVCAENLLYAQRLTDAANSPRQHPILTGEVAFAARHEMCCHPIDFLAHRVALGLVDNEAARAAIPIVATVLQQELGLTAEERAAMVEETREYLSVSVNHTA
jgi:glycerol-3-phosphate dehydrogenase